MGFELAPDPGDRGEPDVKLGRTGGSAVGEDPRLVSAGIQVLARGSLACPECALPVWPAPRLRPRELLACAYCDHEAEAVAFLREDVVDAPANDVVLVARLGAQPA
jgi:hypothetical protein